MNTSQYIPSTTYEQATSYQRLFTRIIDLAIGLIILLPLSGILLAPLESMLKPVSASGWFFFGWFLALLIAYDTILIRVFGKTIGMKITGLRVVDAEGHNLSWGSSLWRAVLLYGSGIVVGFFIGITLTLFGWIFIRLLHEHERFPHDRWSKSFVVREVRGQLKQAEIRSETQPAAAPAAPLAELERLRAEGIITQQEFERKEQETAAQKEGKPIKETLSTPTGDYELATSDRRTWARVVDFWLMFLVVWTPLMVVLSSSAKASPKDADALVFGMLGLCLVLALIYDAIMTRWLGKTVGKMLTGVKVVDVQGNKLSWSYAIRRAILVPASVILVMFLIMLTGRRMRVNVGVRFPHDKWCGSFVAREARGQLKKAAGS